MPCEDVREGRGRKETMEPRGQETKRPNKGSPKGLRLYKEEQPGEEQPRPWAGEFWVEGGV